MIKILFFGDVVGRPGRGAVRRFLGEERDSFAPDLVIANADNLASGRGPTQKTYDEMREMGVDVLTCGDHIWDQKEVLLVLENQDCRLIRAFNYPEVCPGKGFVKLNVKGIDLVVASFMGRTWTAEGLNSPFTTVEELLKDLKERVVIIDFHAEATSEKNAFGLDLAGKVSAVIGTHTHVQTADEKIFSNHTAYISDIGFCGPSDSVIGIDPECSLKRFKTAMPLVFELASGPRQVNGIYLEIDAKTGSALKIERIIRAYED